MAMMITTVDDGRNFGVVQTKDGLLTSIIEKGVKGPAGASGGPKGQKSVREDQ